MAVRIQVVTHFILEWFEATFFASSLYVLALCDQKSPLSKNPSMHLAVHVGQAEVAAAVAVGQPLVIQAHQVQDRGVQVVDVHAVLDGLHAELVGGAVDDAALDAAAGQPHREAQAVVVAALGPFGRTASGRTRRPR